MKIQLKKYITFISKKDDIFVACSAIIIALTSVIYYFKTNKILAYGDAESHINIAKRVTGGLTPGLGQLGGVWLPLHHLMMAPFVINDYLWRTGLGGAIVSAICYVIGVVFLYKLGKNLFKNKSIAIISTAIYALNPNVIYMLATPMSELPLLAFLISSTYFFISWILKNDMRLLILASILSFGGILIRYDAWFLFGIQVVAIILYSIYKKWDYKKAEGLTILFILPAALGGCIWVVWCWLIFDNPLYFLDGPYSAKTQQQAFIARGELPTYHNLLNSIIYYSQAVIDNAGVIVCVIALIGIVILVFNSFKRNKAYLVIILLVLMSSYLFNVVSLYLGISILFLPELTPKSFEFNLFNVRYGMMMLPALAIFVGIVIKSIKLKKFQYPVMALITLVALIFMMTYPITLKDGTVGLSARQPTKDIPYEDVFRKDYDYGYVAFDDFGKVASPIDLNIPMNKIIYVGSHPYWDNMLKNPNAYARFIFIRKNDVLWQRFHNDSKFLKDYIVLDKVNDVTLYKCSIDCMGNVNLTLSYINP